MTAISKFYLKNTSVGVPAGTYPSGTTVISSSAGVRVPGSASNLFMDDTPGASAVGINFDTLAQTTAQPTRFNARWISPALAAQTISSIAIGSGFAANEANAASNLFIAFAAAFWRPSTGAQVAKLCDLLGNPAGTGSATEVGTSATWQTGTTTVAAGPITLQDGDVLIVEAYRDGTNQGMGTAYTNTFWYNGTTEGNAANPASYFEVTNGLELYSPPAASAGDFWGVRA